jgi:hypothetical protein
MIRRLLAALILLLASFAAQAEGPTLLTVAGAIDKPNRGGVDPFLDAFFSFHKVDFARARAFSAADLEALGMKMVRARYKDWPRGFTFEGPLLKDVLAAAGAKGTLARVRALDDYAADIPLAELDKYPVILAIKRDGRYLGLGDRGPAWVIYPRDDFEELRETDELKWVWSAYFIEVE